MERLLAAQWNGWIYIHLSKIWIRLEMWTLECLLSHQSSHQFITNRYYLHQHIRSEFFILKNPQII